MHQPQPPRKRDASDRLAEDEIPRDDFEEWPRFCGSAKDPTAVGFKAPQISQNIIL